MSARYQTIKNFTALLFKRFIDNSCSTYAASLAYTTLLSIVPLLLFVFHVLSYFPALSEAGHRIEQFIVQNFVASSATEISKALQSFVENMHVFSLPSVISLAIISLILIFNIVSAINTVWGVTIKKYLAFSFILYFIFVLIAPILLANLLLMTAYFTSLPIFSHVMHDTFISQPLFFALPVMVEWVAFSFFHWIMPSCRVEIRYAMIAGLLSTILFDLAKFGFATYLHYFPTYRLLYGALATIPIFLVWIYLSWLILIVSALVCHLLQSGSYKVAPPSS